MKGPRFSIVPGALHLDRRLESVDLRVILAFGGAIDKQGWCSRSQVKMARELGVGRATVQRSIERLVAAGYLEKHAIYRESGGDRAHLYRVCFDFGAPDAANDPVPDEPDAGPEEEGGEGGPLPTGEHPCPPVGAPCPPMSGHTLPAYERAPSRTTLPERTEREARASEEEFDEAEFDAFLAAWPTSAVDNRRRTEAAWRRLTAAERREALEGAPAFLAALKAHKRRHPPGGASYLGDKQWLQLAHVAEARAKAGPAAPAAMADAWSRLWWAIALWRIRRGAPKPDIRKMFGLADRMRIGSRLPEDPATRAEIDALSETLVAVMSDRPEADPWRLWLNDRGFDLERGDRTKPFAMWLPPGGPPGEGAMETQDDMARELARG